MTLRNITCAVTLCLLTLSGQAVGKTEVPPYKNKSLSIEKRVDDLMGRMTLRERFCNCRTGAQAVWTR